jgi:hypothetical protein
MMSSSISYTSAKLACLWATIFDRKGFLTPFWVDFGPDGELQITKMPFCAIFVFERVPWRAVKSHDALNTIRGPKTTRRTNWWNCEEDRAISPTRPALPPSMP